MASWFGLIIWWIIYLYPLTMGLRKYFTSFFLIILCNYRDNINILKDKNSIWPDENSTYSCPDLETAKLKLSFLKENNDFQLFFKKLKLSWQKFKQDKGESTLLCKELRYDYENNEQYHMRIHIMHVEGTHFWGGMGHAFNLFENAIFLIQREKLLTTDEFLDMLNPENSELDYHGSPMDEALPKLFISSSVSEFGLCRGLDRSPDGKLQYRRYHYEISTADLKQSERIVKIDLEKNIGQIKKEIEFFIQRERDAQKVREDLSLKLSNTNSKHQMPIKWTVKDKRSQVGAWQKQLEVWQLRGEGWKFNDIASKQGETEDTIKKRFYSAFSEITGEPYCKKVWVKLFREKLERLISKNTSYKKAVYANYQKATEQSRKELLLNDLGNEDSDLLDSIGNEDLQSGESLLNDFLKICDKCSDLDCRATLISAIKNKEYENILPCPQLYKFLKE